MGKGIVVLVDASDVEARDLWSWGNEARCLQVEEGDAAMREQLALALDQGDLIATQGGDRFIGRLIGAHHRHFLGHATPLRLFPLPAGASTTLAQSLSDEERFDRRARRLLKGYKKGNLSEHTFTTLQVSDSTRPHAEYAFNIGFGLFHALYEARERGGLSGATRLATLGVEGVQRARREGQDGSREAPEALLSFDGEVGPAPRALLCGALPRSWFGLALSPQGGTPRALALDEEREVLARLARARAPLALLRGEGERFGALHLDGAARYVIDGEFVEVEAPGVMQIRAGVEVSALA